MVGTVDPVAYALVMDALNHPGPADAARIDRSVCGQVYQPGVDPAERELHPVLRGTPGLTAVATPDVNLAGIPELPAEPPLKCYVFAACSA